MATTWEAIATTTVTHVLPVRVANNVKIVIFICTIGSYSDNIYAISESSCIPCPQGIIRGM